MEVQVGALKLEIQQLLLLIVGAVTALQLQLR